MPIPGSVLNGLNFDPKLLSDDIFPSLGTFYSPTKTNMAGQERHVFSPVADHIDLRCRKAPLILVRPQSQERMSSDFAVQDAKWQVNFDVFRPTPTTDWRLEVDGIMYEIVAIEADGQSLTTRVGVGKVVPYNA